MRAVIQRVSEASVRVDGREVARIGRGFLVLLGIGRNDGSEEVAYMVRKITGMRIFNDPEGKMNLSIADPSVNGEILAVSQFTLLGDVRKGRRPSFIDAEEPGRAERIFNDFVDEVRKAGIPVQRGVFGAMMEVSLLNDGPVTIIVDSDDA